MDIVKYITDSYIENELLEIIKVYAALSNNINDDYGQIVDALLIETCKIYQSNS